MMLTDDTLLDLGFNAPFTDIPNAYSKTDQNGVHWWFLLSETTLTLTGNLIGQPICAIHDINQLKALWYGLTGQHLTK